MNYRLPVLSLVLLAALFYGCEKEPKIFTVKGLLLESSSNPVPVSGYQLEIYRKSGLFGGGISSYAQTSELGEFEFLYESTRRGSGKNDAYIHGEFDKVIAGIAYPVWDSLPPFTDTTLQLFLFKKVDKLLVKLKLEFSIGATDSAVCEFPINDTLSFRSAIYGPVTAGTVVAFDTARNVKVKWFDISRNQAQFYLNCSYAFPGFRIIPMTVLDESYREITL